jgi:nucleoid-associated protein YgaU
MGCVQQRAVLEFDEEIQAPWRPRLVVVPDAEEVVAVEAVRPSVRPHPSRRSPSRVGVCRPPERPASPARDRRTAVPARTGAVPRERPRATMRSGVVASGRPAGAPGRRRPGAGRLRVTRRARRLAVVLALAAGVALGSWLAPLLSGADGGDLRLAGVSSVVVQPGDTLWSIATSVQGDGDVRAVIDEIQRLNHLDDADLVPGQVLQLP